MIERHVTFQVISGKEQAFEHYFVSAYHPAMSGMPGFVRLDLLREVIRSDHYQMVIRFESEEQAAAWRNSAQHEALKPALKALYTESQVQVYEVVA